MRKTWINTYRSLTYNLRTLFFFEILFRLVGLILIFPVVQLLFNLSIKLSGYTYITNLIIFDYILKPTTILFAVVVIIYISIYIVIEMTILSILFDYGYHEKDISLKELLTLGLKKVLWLTKKYRLRILLPALVFFVLVEFFHIVGIASTISIPNELISIIRNNLWFIILFVALIIGSIFLFVEHSFDINLYAIENLSTQNARKDSKIMLKHKRFKLIIYFILLNILINSILYFFYAILILIVGFVISWIKGQIIAFSFVLTILYTIYIIIGFLATLILIPINYALLTTFYYEAREEMGMLPTSANKQKKKIGKIFTNSKTKKLLIPIIILVFAINLSSVLTVVATPKVQLEFFNYAEVVAHRGASMDAPENTLSAIELAIFQNADIIEIDVRETVDGTPVLMHDQTLGRTTNDFLNRRVNQVTYETILSLDAGSWFSSEFIGEKVPTLEEALQTIDSRKKIFIELKEESNRLEQNVLLLIKQYRLENHAVILSFSRDQIKRIKFMNPEVKTLFLLSSFYGDLEALVNASDIDYFGLSRVFIENKKGIIDQAHRANKKVYIWTLNTEQSIKGAVELDVDGIITDVPILAREIIYSRHKPDLLIEILRRLFPTDQ